VETSSDPLVSIVVIAHSVRHELEGCFASIAKHAEVPTETILVDNSSTDDTVKWARASKPDVRLIELDENTWDSARNPAMAVARGRYTMFLDSDARLTAGALPAMVSALDANPDWGLLGPALQYPDGTRQLSCRRFPPLLLPVMRRPPLRRFLESSPTVMRHLMADVEHSKPRPVLYLIAACHLFRTALAWQIGGLDEAIGRGGCADIDWCIRFWDAGSKVVFFPGATVIHDYRRASNRAPLSRGALRHLNSFVRLQWKYRGRRRELTRLQNRLDQPDHAGSHAPV
jgi:GT2 family glycosyltransferase